MTDFGEPWKVSNYIDAGTGRSIAVEKNNIEVECIRVLCPTIMEFKHRVTTYKLITADERDAIAKRIVACVNACAGMADPEAEIKKLRGI